MTSSLPVADLKGNIFRHTIYPPSLIVIAFIVAKLWRGERIPPPPHWPGPKKKKQEKPALDRVNDHSKLEAVFLNKNL